MSRFRFGALALLFATLLAPFTASIASAHGHTMVGDYELVIGFHNEPAYAGEPNGLDLFVTNTKTNQKVNGLEETLKVELSWGDKKVELPVEAQWSEDGAYTAYVIPTETGAYTWRIFGSIENTPVDVSMTAGPDTFSEIASKSSISFPAEEPTTSEVIAQVNQARMFGIGGVALAVIGLVTAAVALFRRPAATGVVARQRA